MEQGGSARGGAKAQRSAATRRALVDATWTVVARRGMDAATLDEIAREAGVTTGAVYHHFSSKSQLLAELSREVAHVEVQLEGATIDEIADELAVALEQLCDERPEALLVPLDVVRASLRADGPPPTSDERREYVQRNADRIDRALRGRGVARDVPPEVVAVLVSEVFFALGVSRLWLGPELVTREVLTRAFRGVLRG